MACSRFKRDSVRLLPGSRNADTPFFAEKNAPAVDVNTENVIWRVLVAFRTLVAVLVVLSTDEGKIAVVNACGGSTDLGLTRRGNAVYAH